MFANSSSSIIAHQTRRYSSAQQQTSCAVPTGVRSAESWLMSYDQVRQQSREGWPRSLLVRKRQSGGNRGRCSLLFSLSLRRSPKPFGGIWRAYDDALERQMDFSGFVLSICFLVN